MRTILLVIAFVALMAGALNAQTPQELRDPEAFAHIANRAERSRALFVEAGKVITHPRCMNCHPATRAPTQGDAMHAHAPVVHGGPDGHGPPGAPCSACHQASNTPLVDATIGSVPGDPHWALAPASMAWQGRSLNQICRLLKDRRRNGGRSLAEIHRHMAEDHLVGWGWRPGDGRMPAPGDQQRFGALIAAWIETGAACPPR